MQCPECRAELDKVDIYSECKQTGYVKDNKIVDYSLVNSVGATDRIECPNCCEDITNLKEWAIEGHANG